MSAALKAEIRTKSAIRSYEEEVGIQVAGSAVLEQVFHQLYLIYLIHETLGEMKFRKILTHASDPSVQGQVLAITDDVIDLVPKLHDHAERDCECEVPC